MGTRLNGRSLAAGTARGIALVLTEPLSLWGGLDPASGELIAAAHPQSGVNAAGRVLVMAAGRGSSSSSSVLAEAVRTGHHPAAILLGEPDLVLAVGATVAAELYGIRVPVVVLAAADLARLGDGMAVEVAEDGTVTTA